MSNKLNTCSKSKGLEALFLSTMFEYIITFLATFFTDLIYVAMVKSIQQDHQWRAAFWSMMVTLAASIAVINYTENHMALIPALLGAFFGTLFGVKMRKKEQA